MEATGSTSTRQSDGKVVLSGLAVELASIYRVRQWLVNRYQHEESSRVDPQYSAGLTMGLSGKSASWLHVLGYWGVARSLATAWPASRWDDLLGDD